MASNGVPAAITKPYCYRLIFVVLCTHRFKLIWGWIVLASLRTFALGLVAATTALGAADAQQAIDQSDYLVQASYARDYARYYAPYAIQAAAAYSAIQSLDGARTQQPTSGYAADVNHVVDYVFDVFGSQEVKTRARESFKAWQYQFGREPFGGPSFQVWARTRALRAEGVACTEVSIAFRGTASLRDWVSNFHPLTGYFVDTHYYQLKRDIDGIIDSIKELECYKQAQIKPKIVSTGHSLGGGLAQFAALANRPGRTRITKVLAFDPSPITGASLVDAKILSKNVKGLTIDRIYQPGEGLSYVRSLAQQYPSATSRCDPFVRTVRVDAIPTGGLIGLHGMPALAAQMVQLSYKRQTRLDYEIPPSPSRCELEYSPPVTDEEIVASARRQKLTVFTPNYGGYADQLGASYASTQESGQSIKAAGVGVRRVALLPGGSRSRRGKIASSHKVVAQIEGPAFFLPLSPAQ